MTTHPDEFTRTERERAQRNAEYHGNYNIAFARPWNVNHYRMPGDAPRGAQEGEA